ncbi:P-loop NTPase fold protein [uncultured Roseibium sp.]|uniref:P-loop NTPase fold protein n=1 Tax=uncultured Roseibium sp. TaxID=1936171 RepID=UPI003216D8B0
MAFSYTGALEKTKDRLITNAALAAANAAAATNAAFAATNAAAAANAALAATNAAATTKATANAALTNATTNAALAAANAALAADALNSDRRHIDSGLPVQEFASLPLWSDGQFPGAFAKYWEELKSQLLSRDEDWDVWTQWYEDRLAGNPPEDEALAVARVTLPEPMWREGPKLVNATIKELTEFYNKGGPEMLEARMAELREQYPEETSERETSVSASRSSEVTPEDVGLFRENLDPEEIGPRFGRLVRQKRNEADLSQFQLALKAFDDEKRQASISELETGKVRRPTAETVQAIAQALELTDEELAPFRDLLETGPPETPAGEAPEAEQSERTSDALPNAWILQYNVKDWADAPQRIAQGTLETWKTRGALPRNLQPNDPVIYWRTTEDGGFVGTGHVLSRDLGPEDEEGWRRFPTEVHEFDQSRLIPRDKVIEAAGIARKIWQGAVLPLSEEEAVKIDDLLRREGRLPLFPDRRLEDEARLGTGSGEPAPEQDTRFVPDDAEIERDDLGRGVLAIALARRLHLIWCRINNAMPREAQPDFVTDKTEAVDSSAWTGETGNDGVFFDRTRQKTRAGFVLHLDAPWGGGKTTFANFLARVLNPTGFRHGQDSFLKKRYGEADLSTIFLSDPVTGTRTGTGDGRDWPEDARRPWIIVPFNAWQFEHVKPPWWVFYQTIRRRCFASVLQEGIEPTPGSGAVRFEYETDPRVGAWLKLWRHEISWRLANPKVVTLFLTAVVSGLLLFALSAFGVLDQVGSPDKQTAGFVVSTSAGFLLSGLTGISLLWSIGAIFTESIRPGTNTLAERLSLGSGDPFERFRKHFYRTMEKVKRPVLVIVDDLDRCNPEFIVDLVRGMQTLLRSPRVVFVVLGDRDWIERAFEVHHKNMSKVSVGPEQTFGARFVEKAIQMSFILPGLDKDRQKNYVRRLLLGAKADRQMQQAPTLSTDANQNLRLYFQRAVNEKDAPVLDSEDLKQRVQKYARKAAEEMAQTQTPVPEAGSADTPSETRETTAQTRGRTVGEEVTAVLSNPQVFDTWFKDEFTIHVAADEDVETEISHRLEPLADNLPANPRQIKRIVNGVTMYNAVAFRQTEWKPDSERWLQLARWIVIMTEWPKTWRLLASYPMLANLLFAQDPADALNEMKKDPNRAAELPTSDDAALEEIIRIKGDLNLMALIEGDGEGERLDHVVVSELIALTPLHSRETELSAPESGDE